MNMVIYLGTVTKILFCQRSTPSGRLFSSMYWPLVLASASASGVGQSKASCFHENFSSNLAVALRLKIPIRHKTRTRLNLNLSDFIFAIGFDSCIFWISLYKLSPLFAASWARLLEELGLESGLICL